jgi:hypothetical protein
LKDTVAAAKVAIFAGDTFKSFFIAATSSAVHADFSIEYPLDVRIVLGSI